MAIVTGKTLTTEAVSYRLALLLHGSLVAAATFLLVFIS